MTQDELDQQSITQLHTFLVEVSKNCFELKKLCATVVGSSLTLFATFTVNRMGPLFFVGGAVIVFFFWMADAQSFFYQEKIRLRMKSLQDGMLERSHANLIFDGVGMPISANRQSSSVSQRVWESVFNWSMAFYYGLLVIDAMSVLAYHFAATHSKP